MYDYLLPLGSIVEVKNVKRKIMIIGYLQKTPKDKDVVYDYVGVTYPEGFYMLEMSIVFLHSDIENLLFKGYETDELSMFISLMGYAAEKDKVKAVNS